MIISDASTLDKLIKRDLYQVFLLVSPASIPINFASHPWFVINRKGVISRWEVNFFLRKSAKSWGHLDLDFLPPHLGMRVIAFIDGSWWKARLIGSIEGDENSVAARMADFISKSDTLYPYTKTYSLIGYNSNTYAQWVLNHFSEVGMKLPWNSLGRYKAAAMPLSKEV